MAERPVETQMTIATGGLQAQVGTLEEKIPAIIVVPPKVPLEALEFCKVALEVWVPPLTGLTGVLGEVEARI